MGTCNGLADVKSWQILSYCSRSFDFSIGSSPTLTQRFDFSFGEFDSSVDEHWHAADWKCVLGVYSTMNIVVRNQSA